MYRTTVLHVVESFGGGVASAIGTYVQQTPDVEHHIIVHERADAPLAGDAWKEPFASVAYLSDSHIESIHITRRVMREVRPDVVHSHSSYGGLYARLSAGAFPSARQVYTPHGWAFTRLDKSRLERMAFWLAEGALGLKTDMLAACSPNEGRVAPRLRSKKEAVVVVPNITPTAEPAQDDETSLELPPVPAGNGPLIVGSGRFHMAKDPGFFLKAIEAVRTSGYEVRAQWIGGGEPEWEHRLRNAGIDVTGWTTPELTAQLLGRADYYLHSSLWDGFPLTVLQAFHRGVPTLLRNIASFRGMDWPYKLDTPQDLGVLWPEVNSSTGRQTLLQGASVALADNTPETQRLRLLEAYGLDRAAEESELT